MEVDDRRYLAHAIALAERARAHTAPNPAVGCVLVRDGAIVGAGSTRPAGNAHAEVVALDEAGVAARGATAYVTLAPCTHVGRTGACTDALIAAGVARVVIGLTDPNPIAGDAATALSPHGIAVSTADPTSTLAGSIRRQLEGFLTVVARRRPHVTLKLAQTTAGALSAPVGHRWITGRSARAAVHRWRASVDAVLVGIGTVLADDPQLTVRNVATTRQPRAIVVDSTLRMPVDAAVIRPGTLVLTTTTAAETRADRLEAAGATVHRVAATSDGRVALDAALGAVARAGVTSVLAEPGRTLATALVDADLVDRIVVHVAAAENSAVVRAVSAPACTRVERVGGAGADLIVQHVRPTDA